MNVSTIIVRGQCFVLYCIRYSHRLFSILFYSVYYSVASYSQTLLETATLWRIGQTWVCCVSGWNNGSKQYAKLLFLIFKTYVIVYYSDEEIIKCYNNVCYRTYIVSFIICDQWFQTCLHYRFATSLTPSPPLTTVG